MDAAITTPAGWYADPHGGGQRYWDGLAWTEHTTAMGAAQSAAIAGPDTSWAQGGPPVPAQHASPQYPHQLQSEKVVVSAPLSFHGSAARIWKITKQATGGAQVALGALAVLLVALAWTFVLCWYLTWGLWLVPYRLIRRGSRQRKRQALQHRELIAAVQQQPPQG
jgi:Protein of unknown function (DUF2510)